MIRYINIISIVVGFCLGNSSWALELNFGGEEIKVSTKKEAPQIRGEKGFKVSIRSQVYSTSISGNTSRSFRDKGTHYENLISLSLADKSGLFRLKADFRNTDDLRVQKERTKLCGLLLSFGREDDYVVKAGDVSVQGNRYAFSRSIKGVSYGHNLLNGDLKVQGGYGRIHEAKEGSQFQRMLLAGGLDWRQEVDHPLLEDLRMSLSYAETWDDEESINNKGGLSADKNEVLGLGADLQFKDNLKIKGEVGISSFQDDSDSDTIRGSAFSLKLEKGFENTNIRGNWEQAGPDFRSLSGSANPDTRRLSGDFNTRLGKKITFSTGINQNKDNLDGKKAITTTATSPDISLSIRPFGGNLCFSPNMNWTFHKASDNSMERKISNQNYRLSTNLKKWQASINYNNQGTKDKITPANDREGSGGDISLSRSGIIKSRRLTSDLSLSYNQSSDGLKKNPKNKRTNLRLGSSGNILQISYSCSLSIEDADYASGTNNYKKTGWNLSLSRKVYGLDIGLILNSSYNKDKDPSNTFRELTFRLQILGVRP